jgi:hypothetical protein
MSHRHSPAGCILRADVGKHKSGVCLRGEGRSRGVRRAFHLGEPKRRMFVRGGSVDHPVMARAAGPLACASCLARTSPKKNVLVPFHALAVQASPGRCRGSRNGHGRDRVEAVRLVSPTAANRPTRGTTELVSRLCSPATCDMASLSTHREGLNGSNGATGEMVPPCVRRGTSSPRGRRGLRGRFRRAAESARAT